MHKWRLYRGFIVLTLSAILGILVLTACGDNTATPATTNTGTATTAAGAATTTATSATSAAAVATTAGQSGAKTVPTGKVVIGIGGDPSSLDPQLADDYNERNVNDNIYETLLVRDPVTLKLGPGLADKWEQVDPTTWRFTLHQGIKFTNGEDFNADAVVVSVNRIIDPAFKSQQASFFTTIGSAKKVDNYTVDILTQGSDPILPSRMYWMKMVPAKYSAEKDFADKPVGTGPYKFVEWKRGQSVTLVANEAYWGGAPAIKDVVIRPYSEAAQKLPGLKRGEVDLVTSLLPEQLSQAPKSASVPGLEFPMVRLANKTGPLTDVRVRQALNYAIDKESIVKNILGGNAVLSQGQVLRPDAFGFNTAVTAYPYDPEKAKALLKEANAEGMAFDLVSENGRWLKDKEVVEAISQQLQKVGLKPSVKINEWSRYLDLLFATDTPPNSIFVSNSNELFDADRTYSAYFMCKGRASSYCNDQVDKLLDQARNEVDTAKRASMYQQVMKITRDDAAMLYLYNVNDIYGMTARLDWKPRGDAKILVKEMKLTS